MSAASAVRRGLNVSTFVRQKKLQRSCRARLRKLANPLGLEEHAQTETNAASCEGKLPLGPSCSGSRVFQPTLARMFRAELMQHAHTYQVSLLVDLNHCYARMNLQKLLQVFPEA